MSTPARTYKRSWKNYLIYSGYQLRLTAFMVTVVGLVIAGLGYWVHKSSRQSTTVAVLSAQGQCPTPQATPTAAPIAPSGNAAADTRVEPAADAEATSQVVLDESSMVVVPPLPFTIASTTGMNQVQYQACLAKQAANIAELRAGQTRITWAMGLAGLGLLLVMTIYSIKMTHKVGGPLFKVTSHLRHWAGGTYDKIWGLRKGDDLVVFFDHFRLAHQRVIDDQKQDLALAREVAAAITDPEARAEVEALIARKEEALKHV